ncbi:MAG: hypothetical protein F4X65_14160 [Chloroflexi bacterium]|nr:hypothetical protein [Chloroflexota bacterium]
MEGISRLPPGLAAISSTRGEELATGLLLLLYTISVIVSIFARLSVTGDVVITMPVEVETNLTRRGTEPVWQYTSYAATLAGAFILAIAAALASRAFWSGSPSLALAGAFMFLGASFFGGLSALVGLVLSQGFYGPLGPGAILTSQEGFALLEAFLEPVRSLAGNTAFTFAALGTICFGSLIALRGAVPRWLGWFGVASGFLMFFIWLEDGAFLHRLGGGAYLVWLLLLGVMLISRGTRYSKNQAADLAKERSNV